MSTSFALTFRAGSSVLYFSEVSIVMFVTKMKIHAVDTESEAA